VVTIAAAVIVVLALVDFTIYDSLPWDEAGQARSLRPSLHRMRVTMGGLVMIGRIFGA